MPQSSLILETTLSTALIKAPTQPRLPDTSCVRTTSMEDDGDSNNNAEDSSSDDDCCRQSSLLQEDMLLSMSTLFTMVHDQGHFDSQLLLRRLMDIKSKRLIGGRGVGGGEDADDGLFSLFSPVM
jgi:hypothetical protein